MSTGRPDPLTPEERALAQRLARTQAPVEPSAALDARILAAARAQPGASTVNTHPAARARRPRWPIALGLAASLTLAVGIAWQLRPAQRAQQVASEAPMPATPAHGPSADVALPEIAPAAGPDTAPAANPAEAATRQPSAPAQSVPAPASSPAPTPEPESRARGVARAAPEAFPVEPVSAPAAKAGASEAGAPRLPMPPAPAAPPPPPPPDAARTAVDTSERSEAKALQLRRDTSAPVQQDAPAPAGAQAAAPPIVFERTDAGAAPADASDASDNDADADAGAADQAIDDEPPATADSPAVQQAWLQRIRGLLADGQGDAARASLAEFRRRYPAYALPDDLRALDR